MSNPVNDVAKTLGLDRQSKVTSRLKPYLIWGGIALAVVLLVWFWIGRQSTGLVQYQT